MAPSRFQHEPSAAFKTAVGQLVGLQKQEHIADYAFAEAVADEWRDSYSSGMTEAASGAYPMCFCPLANLPPTVDKSDHVHEPPPGCDHGSVWEKDGVPQAIIFHPYVLSHSTLRHLMSWAEGHGLEVLVDPTSWYFPSGTLRVMITPPDAQ